MAASSFFLLPMLNCCLWQWEGFYSQRPQLVRLPFIVSLLGCGAERKHCHQHHHPPPPPLCLCSLLVLRAIIFIWKPIRGHKEKRDMRKWWRGEGGHTERQSGAGEENCDSSEAVIDATSMCLHVASKNEGSIDLLPYFKKVGSQPQIFLCTSMNYQLLTK